MAITDDDDGARIVLGHAIREYCDLYWEAAPRPKVDHRPPPPLSQHLLDALVAAGYQVVQEGTDDTGPGGHDWVYGVASCGHPEHRPHRHDPIRCRLCLSRGFGAPHAHTPGAVWDTERGFT